MSLATVTLEKALSDLPLTALLTDQTGHTATAAEFLHDFREDVLGGGVCSDEHGLWVPEWARYLGMDRAYILRFAALPVVPAEERLR